ncbi:MAG TPA: ABC transporter substrate-binding protein [Polyangiaceae bacterium]
MKLRRFLSVSLVCLSLALSGSALADTPDGFVKTGQTNLTGLLKQPASGARDAQLTATFDKLVDYSELVRRCFKEDWAGLSEAQKSEVGDLLHKLVEKNYRKNLKRTLDYTVTYTGTAPVGNDTRVRSEAKSNTNPRDPVVQIDYVVMGPAGGPYHIVDIVTEGSFLTNSYYTQFHKMLAPTGQGYAYLVSKLKEKLAKPD